MVGENLHRHREKLLTRNRDQELRFTVHESPDYYKLKCSVFNDDKKTDLISETWIDLHDVIVPGGGQSDQWRQLNFKGKYAGDIRIELTYYDTRPKPEIPVEARKQRDQAHSTASEVNSSSSASRQLGPRDIKRRPLPPGPGGYSSPVSDRWPAEGETEISSDHAYLSTNPPPRPPKQKFIPETPDDVGYELNPRFGPQSYEPLYQPTSSYQQNYSPDDVQPEYEPSTAPYPESETYTDDPFMQQLPPRRPKSRSGSEARLQAPTHSPYEMPDPSSYQSSPPLRTPPSTPPYNAQMQPWNPRASTSLTKYTAYRDSPLRQSVIQTNMPESAMEYAADSRFDQEEPIPPPLPPAHRGQLSRLPVGSGNRGSPREQTSFEAPVHAPHRDSYEQPSPRTLPKPQVVEERSPLQRLEQEYDPFQATPPSTQGLQVQCSQPHSHATSPSADFDRYPIFPTERRKSNTNDMIQMRPASANDETTQDSPRNLPLPRKGHQEGPQNDFRSSTGYAPPRRAQTFDSYETHDERHVRSSDPLIVRPRAISPNPNHIIPRKSITPTTRTPEGSRDLSASPYGPNSYDVLNPGTSPIAESGGYNLPQDTQEAARQKEVDKLRDQGPIIGNDGRVIDPSDHLPADTWAPEPERKPRRPEHVIKIRTREEARQHRSTGSSPSSARPHSIAATPYQNPAYESTPSLYNSSPAPHMMPASPQADSYGSRNRLSKPMAQRPLSTQPYFNSSPVVRTLPLVEPRPNPINQRHAVHSSPVGALPQRPPMSDYQVPAANDFSPRGVFGSPGFEYRPEHTQQTPTRPPVERPPMDMMDYGGGSPYGGEDSLALELSRIDIGPSRAGRTTLRPQRAYGAY